MKNNGLSLLKLLGAAALLAPAFALAQTTADSFQPSDTDMTRWLIKAIFGDYGNGQQVPMLGGAMQVLNMFAQTFGTLMFTYVAVIGTLNTAQDGELLGRKWSSMWIPVRFTAGTALLVPLASGYSAIQHFILWLAMAGGGAASMVWGAAVDNFGGSQTSAAIYSQDFDAKVQDLMRSVLKAEVCNAVNQARLSEATGTSVPFDLTVKNMSSTTTLPVTIDSVDTGASNTSATTYYTIAWGPTSDTSGQSFDACGSLRTTSFTSQDSGSFSLNSGTMLSSSSSASYSGGSMGDNAAVNSAGVAFVTAQADGIKTAAILNLRPLARKYATTIGAVDGAEISAAIAAAATTYKNAIAGPLAKTGSAFQQKLTAFTQSSKQAGWLMAGSTFFQMAVIRSAVTKMAAAAPTMNTGSLQKDNLPGVTDAAIVQDIAAMDAQIDKNFQGVNNGHDSAWWNPGDKLASVLGRFVSFNPTNPTHALVQIKDTGDDIIMGTEVVAGGMMAAAGVAIDVNESAAGKLASLSGVAGVLNAGLELFKIALPAIYAGFIACFAVGITMAFVIPMLPFTLTIGSVVGWLMALFSAMVAGPVWLAGHLHPEGDDIAGKGVGGYMILLETVTRPIFIIFGLIGAFLIMDPVLKLVALMFKANVSSLQGSSTTGIVSIVVLALLYASIVLTTVRSCMSMVHVLSETVYRWIGGSHAGMEQAREFHADAQAGAAGATRGLQTSGAAASAARMNRLKIDGGGSGSGGRGGAPDGRTGKTIDASANADG